MRTIVASVDPAAIVPSLDDVKVQRRLEDRDDQDVVLNVWRQAALLRCERATRRLFVPRVVTLQLDWRFPARIALPWMPCGEVQSIKYLDEAGAEQTLDPSRYEVNAQYGVTPNEIVPTHGATWPAVACRRNAITITYVAGELPDAQVQTAMLLLIGHWDEAREETQAVDLRSIPDGAAGILFDYKI